MNILVAFLIIAFLIVTHELGHLFAARLANIRVIAFSMGFGPVLLRRKFKGTEYRFSLIPLGGYILMDDGHNPVPTGPDAPSGLPLAEATYKGRLFTLFAGVLANFLTAIACIIAILCLKGHPFPEAFVLGFQKTFALLGLILSALGALVTGHGPAHSVSGPIGIVQVLSQAASGGWIQVLSLTALLSLNLAVMNLLPIPILDGGQIILLTIERIRRKTLHPRLEGLLVAASLILLVGLLAYGTSNDLSKPTPEVPTHAVPIGKSKPVQ